MSTKLNDRINAIRKLEHIRPKVVNERVAVWSTLVFGSMWTFYLFFLYGFLPLMPHLGKYQDKFLYWGSWVQLWALPLLMVGNIVLNRGTEVRAAQDHETLMEEFAELKEIQAEIGELKETLRRIEEKLSSK